MLLDRFFVLHKVVNLYLISDSDMEASVCDFREVDRRYQGQICSTKRCIPTLHLFKPNT